MYFARSASWQCIDQLDNPRDLVDRESTARPLEDRVAAHPAACLRLEGDERLHRLATPGVGRGDDGDLQDVGMRIQRHLHFRRPHFVAGGIDHALEAIGDVEVPVRVVVAEIAGAQKAAAVDLDERRGRRVRIVPVALEDLRAARDDFTALVRRKRPQGVRVDHERLGVERRNPEALFAQIAGRVHVRLRDGFGHPVRFHILDAATLVELLRYRFRHCGAAAEYVAQRG